MDCTCHWILRCVSQDFVTVQQARAFDKSLRAEADLEQGVTRVTETTEVLVGLGEIYVERTGRMHSSKSS